MKLATPDTAEIAIYLTVIILEHTWVDTVRANDGSRLGLERSFGTVGYGNTKMVALMECDSFSTLGEITSEKAGWLYFMPWYDGGKGTDDFLSNPLFNTVEDLIEMYQSDYCITLDELPADLYGSGSSTPSDPKEEDPKEEDPKEEDPKEEDPKEEDPQDEPSGEILYGDVNLDGAIDIMDVIALNKFLLGSSELDKDNKAAADVDLNGQLDSTDSLNILKRVVDLIAKLPVSGDTAEITTEPLTDGVVLD